MSKDSRRKSEPRHTRLYHTMTGCEAWRALSGNAVKALVALVRLDNGSNNGDIFFSARTAAQATGLTKNTAHKCLVELEEKGFIRKTSVGRFHPDGGIASKYRCTWQAWPGHGGPTREFEKWKPEQNKKLSQNLNGSVPKIGQVQAIGHDSVSLIGTVTSKSAQKPVPGISPNIDTQVVYQDGSLSDDPETDLEHDGPDSGGDNDWLRELCHQVLSMGGSGSQSTLAKSAAIPPATLSRFLTGKDLPIHHHSNLELAIGRAWPRKANA